MPFKTLSLMIVLLLGVVAGPAAAEKRDKPKWGKGGSWGIYVGTNAGNVCYAVRGFPGGTGILVSVRSDGGLHVAIANESWHFAEPGQTRQRQLDVGRDKRSRNGPAANMYLKGFALVPAAART